jgi:hypothetical protein
MWWLVLEVVFKSVSKVLFCGSKSEALDVGAKSVMEAAMFEVGPVRVHVEMRRALGNVEVVEATCEGVNFSQVEIESVAFYTVVPDEAKRFHLLEKSDTGSEIEVTERYIVVLVEKDEVGLNGGESFVDVGSPAKARGASVGRRERAVVVKESVDVAIGRAVVCDVPEERTGVLNMLSE